MKFFTKKEINSFPFLIENTLYFDIETTGFINTDSHIYMIGMFFLDKNIINYTFIFAENICDEYELIIKFKNILESFDTFATFNGSTFDIPYINRRCIEYGISIDFSAHNSFDMYRDFRKFKNFFGLDKLKQKYIEEFLGIYREDEYSGGELISLYNDYTVTKSSRLEHIITLHNINDMEGMAIITNLYNYIRYDLWSYLETIENSMSVVFRYTSKYKFVKSHSLHQEHFSINYHDNFIDIVLSKIETECKYYFINYKDYYYLPFEDYAVHKSVGQYVDKGKRKQATRLTAYIKKYSIFMKLPYRKKNVMYKDIKDNFCFVEVNSIDTLDPYDILESIMHIAFTKK